MGKYHYHAFTSIKRPKNGVDFKRLERSKEKTKETEWRRLTTISREERRNNWNA